MLLKRKLSSLFTTGYKNRKSFLLFLAIFIFFAISLLEIIPLIKSQATYNKSLKKLKIFQDAETEGLLLLTSTRKKDSLLQQELSDDIGKYQHTLAENFSSLSPEAFQGKLQQDNNTLEEQAALKHVLLPPSFFLGLEQYKEVLPSLEEVTLAEKQEIILNWIIEELINYPNLVVNKFQFENKSSLLFSTKNYSVFSLGYLILSITTKESDLHKIINNFITSPYFLIIKKIAIENSVPLSPVRSIKNNISEKERSGIKIIFGREKNTLSMILQLLELRN